MGRREKGTCLGPTVLIYQCLFSGITYAPTALSPIPEVRAKKPTMAELCTGILNSFPTFLSPKGYVIP